jgi:nucleoid-associated protein YgaU
MAITDLSSSSKPHMHRRVSLRQPLRCGFTIALCSCLFFGAAQCRAQASQDVAEAARQERARKDQAKKQKHVYTDEDLRRAKILTPEDEAVVEAKRKQQLQPAEEQAQAPIDADTGLAQLPLGDIARRYRNAKIAAQTPDPFHLPFDELIFAAPVISVPELDPPRPSFSPAHPNVVSARPNAIVAPAISSPVPLQRLDPAISLPKLARPAQSFSPARPNLAPVQPQSVVAPAISSPAPLRRLDPFTRRFAPSAPPSVSRIAPVAPQPKAAPAMAPHAEPRIVAPSIAPSAPKPSVTLSNAQPSAPTKNSSSLHTVIIQPGDSLWNLALQNLGRGSRWQELLAANPGIVDPTRIAVGTEIVVPAKVTGLKSDLKVTVRQGNTLSSIARVTYGRAAAWRCIAQANPEIADANRIYVGQQLLLPFHCQQ